MPNVKIKVDYPSVEIPESLCYTKKEVDKMLYQGDNPIIQIESVEHLHWGDGTFRVAPRNYCALAFRIRGTATIESNGNLYTVGTNEILYLPQDLGYTATYTDTEMLVFHFVTRRSDKRIEVYSMEDSGRIYKLFLRAHALWQNREPGYTVYAMSQLYAVLGTILETQTKTNLPPHFLRAVAYINENYRSAVTMQTICENCGISATVFRQLFKQHYRKTPVAYITELRLEHARNRIAGGISIEQAAAESGFNDPKYFARVVKKYFDCTPRDLKNYGK